MKVDLDLEKLTCIVTREPSDPIFRRGGWSDAESRFLYHVKLALRAQGFDVIKKRMARDGHLVDDYTQYIRDRNFTFCIFNCNNALYDIGEQFNQAASVSLTVERF